MDGNPATYEADLAEAERRIRSTLRMAHVIYWTVIAVLLPPGIVLTVVFALGRRAARAVKRFVTCLR
jgi:hypothetical protein